MKHHVSSSIKKRNILFFYAPAVMVCLMVFAGMAQSGDDLSKVLCRVETDRAVLPSGGPQNVVIKVTLDAPPAPVKIQRPSVNLALVLDQSGSMAGAKIEQAKAAAVEALRRLGFNDVFSVVAYDTHVRTIVPAQHTENIQSIIQHISRIHPGGSTALFGGVSQGASEIRKNLGNDFVHRIILLSDGLANVGPRTPQDLGRLGAALIKESISVSTVGVGTDYNEDLMAQLSQQSDGNTYFVESGYDLSRIFAAELGDVLNVVAKKVKITITLPEDVEPVEIIGREGRIKGRKMEVLMNQLYGDQEKYALIEVKLPRSKPGSQKMIARADVVYENPFTQKTETSNGYSIAKFSSDPVKVKKSTNIDVVRQYQLNLNALAQERAIELSDQGKKKEAVQALKQSAARLKSAGAVYQDKTLVQEAESIEDRAKEIETKGMSKKSRKVLRTESYQMKNQQMSQ